MPYAPREIEPGWQKYWLEHGTFRSEIDPTRPKLYILDMFPYPSGEGLHVGHPKGYVATDVYARYKRMRGFNVLHPMGWDAFGLPAEQHAVKTGQHPRVTTTANVAHYRQQLQSLGLSYDWDREIDTTDPGYVRWTQWIFCKLYERGLAYQEEVPVNWCPELGTALANEEVKDGRSEIGGFPVIRMPLKQWVLKITAYADRLIEDLDEVDWPESIRKMQIDWIGRSEGAQVRFPLADVEGEPIEVYTTRPDTLFGATYLVLAPEHPMVDEVTTPDQREAVRDYVEVAARKSERSRIADVHAKTGVPTGGHAINPVNDEKIPIWIADYVLISYGSGAIMAVPGHDERDYSFAQEFDLPIAEVVIGGDISREAFVGEGVNVNSGFLDGLATDAAKSAMIDWLEEQGKGHGAVNYKLRDWVFSRQRYWGEPFPVLHLADGTTKLVPEQELPVLLPEIEDFRPSGDFEPPLARVRDWIETTDPETGEPAQRDPNTMPQWAGSCWYYLRFCDPTNDEAAWSPEAEKYWMNVDLYVGGAEHAVLHLLYARFWHKVLYDLGLVSTKEPFQKLLSPGMIQGKSYRYFGEQMDDGAKYYSSADVRYEGETPVHVGSGAELKELWVAPSDVRWEEMERPLAPDVDIELEEVIEKMSKSRGNVVNPDDVIEEFGADSLRLFEMFIGPLAKAAPWKTEGIPGVARFLQRVYRLFIDDASDALRELPEGAGSEAQQKLLARTVHKVGEDYEKLSFNTAISALMVFVRDVEREGPMPLEIGEAFVRLLAPMAPHLCEEIWERLGHTHSIALESWPEFDPALLVEEEVEIGVQVQGKMRARVRIPADADQDAAYAVAAANENVARHIGSREPRRLIYVPGRLLNIVL
ncbi:MAG: leucine--tRNA ligase [Myxococcota bacterium]